MRTRGAVILVLALFLGTRGAAAATGVPLNDEQRALHFLNRAGFGPRPEDVQRVQQMGLFMYIQQQLHPESLPDVPLQSRLSQMRTWTLSVPDLVARYLEPQQIKKLKATTTAELRDYHDILQDLQDQRLLRAVDSPRQLQEVMVDFWMNHFNVFYYKGLDRWLLTSYERDVIRPRVLGRFRDLLGATAHSPAMLVYLDNWLSRQPYPQGKEKTVKPGLNENYARELLELHTLGVDGGYTQRDVVEVARCFTGWTINRGAPGYPFAFRADWHDNGRKVVLGHVIAAGGGVRDGEQVLDILAQSSTTAHFLASQLCRDFVSDNPPPDLVNRVANSYLRSDGDIRMVLGTLFNSAEFWSPHAFHSKIKTPFRLVVSAMRAVGASYGGSKAVPSQLAAMGMGLYLCDVPTGYTDRAEKWMSPGSLLQRLNFCMALSRNQLGGVSVTLRRLTDGPAKDAVSQLIQNVVHGDVTESTRSNIMRAAASKPDYATLVGLLLGSPDFQRR